MSCACSLSGALGAVTGVALLLAWRCAVLAVLYRGRAAFYAGMLRDDGWTLEEDGPTTTAHRCEEIRTS